MINGTTTEYVPTGSVIISEQNNPSYFSEVEDGIFSWSYTILQQSVPASDFACMIIGNTVVLIDTSFKSKH